MASALEVKQPTISEWLRGERRVPAERCPQIERETKRIAAERGDASLIVTCEQLRDDVAWEVLREQVPDPRGPDPQARERPPVETPPGGALAGEGPRRNQKTKAACQ